MGRIEAEWLNVIDSEIGAVIPDNLKETYRVMFWLGAVSHSRVLTECANIGGDIGHAEFMKAKQELADFISYIRGHANEAADG